MQLSVVILNYNVRYFLELCLKSVESALVNIDSEIIVVDNNSSDDSCTMVKTLFPKVTCIENKENYGFSKGNNIGVAKAKGKYLCILNPDTVVAEDTFTHLLKFAEIQANLGITGCQLIDGSGAFLPESKRHVPKPDVALQKLLGNTKNYYNHKLGRDEVGKTEVLVGAFMFLSKALYHEVGGFDEDYFMYGEDIDLSFKVLKKGYVNFYFGKTTVIHFKGESTIKNKTYRKRFYGAMDIFYNKHFGRNWFLSVAVRLFLMVAKNHQSVKKDLKPTNKNAMVVSNELYPKLRTNLRRRTLTFGNSFRHIVNDTQVIFDVNNLKFKSIISFMRQDQKAHKNTYRFLIKNSNFIIGSDSNLSNGEVIKF